MADYDKYYETEDLFGEAYPELIDFLSRYPKKGKVLDLGCGQGRDAIPLARLGYSVTGIDSSKVGIDQMNEIAKKDSLDICGMVGDIYAFDDYQDFDLVLLDSMFHFAKQDKKRELELIQNIATGIAENSVLCVCIQDSGDKVKMLKDTIHSLGIDFMVLNDSSLIYTYEDKESAHRSETTYRLYIVEKK